MIEEWIDNASSFYDRLKIETDFLTTISKFKLTAERIDAEQSAVLNLKVLRNKAAAEKGEAQEATIERNEKLSELDDFTIELKGLAELALSDKPQLLEKLGIKV